MLSPLKSLLVIATSGSIALCISVCSLAGGVLLERSLARRKLIESVERHDTEKVEEFFRSFEHASKRIDEVAYLIGSEPQAQTPSSNTAYRFYFFRIAVKENFAELNSTQHLLEDLTANLELAAIPRRRDLERLFQALRNAQEASENANHATAELSEKLRRLRDAHKLIAADFARLLSLHSKYDSPNDSKDDSLQIYRSGVLANLPILIGLSDEIPDLIALRSEIEHAGGKVSLGGENVAEEFSKTLEDLRKASTSIINEYSNMKQQREKNLTEITSLEGKIYTQRQSIKRFALSQL